MALRAISPAGSDYLRHGAYTFRALRECRGGHAGPPRRSCRFTDGRW